MVWFIIGSIVTLVALAVVAVCMTVFGIVTVLSVPPDRRIEATRAVGEAWGRWGRRR